MKAARSIGRRSTDGYPQAMRLTLPTLAALACCILPAAEPAWTWTETPFPADAGLSVKDLGAVGDGVTDDTAAFQKAFTNDPKAMLIIVPAGTYLLSDTIKWGPGQKRQVLQGAGAGTTILRLKDHAPGFDDVKKPKSVLWTGREPAQRFRNGIRNICLDTGTGNPGAIGVQFISNNQGGMHQVLIRAGDDGGAIGLDLAYTKEQGPCLIHEVAVRGFAVGVAAKGGVDSITFEGLDLEGQRTCGIRNEGQVISLRQLASRNAVPVLLNLGEASLATVIESDLRGQGAAKDIAAISNAAGGLFLRGVKTPGYARAADNSAGTKLPAEGPTVAEFSSHEVLGLFPGGRTSLNLPVLETPRIPWDPVAAWVPVTRYKPQAKELQDLATGRPVTVEDWAPALQEAIDAGASTIYFPRRSGEYAVIGKVFLRNHVQRVIGCENTLLRVLPEDKDATKVKAALEADADSEPAGHGCRFGDEGRPIFVCEDGDAPAVAVERFDAWYSQIRWEQRSTKRSLLVSSLSFFDGEAFPGTAPTFCEDVRVRDVRVGAGASFYARQMNPEGWQEPRTQNHGGLFWVLGLKTEGDATIHLVDQGGRSEIVGCFVYANKNTIPVKQMFIIRDAKMSFTVGESVMRQAPFDPVEETRGGETRRLLKGQAPLRGKGGSLITLYVAK